MASFPEVSSKTWNDFSGIGVSLSGNLPLCPVLGHMAIVIDWDAGAADYVDGPAVTDDLSGSRNWRGVTVSPIDEAEPVALPLIPEGWLPLVHWGTLWRAVYSASIFH